MKTVLEYLTKEDGSGCSRITRHQARMVGIPYPLVSGWKDMASKIYLTEEEGELFGKLSRVAKKARKAAGEDALHTPDKYVHISKEFILSKEFYSSREWREVRYKALRKHGARCQCCGVSPTHDKTCVLHVDHIIPRTVDHTVALNLKNLQVLCSECNLGKSNKDSTSWGKDYASHRADLVRLRMLMAEHCEALDNAIKRLGKLGKGIVHKTVVNGKQCIEYF